MTGFVEPRRVDHLDAFRDSADEVSSRPSGPTRKIRRRRDTKSYTWILRTAHGAALVDAGSDPKGEAALEALKAQGLTQADVHTILLTHGHKDHWAAAALFPNAKIRVSADDVAMVKGDRKYQPALIDKLTNAPAEQPRALEALGEDETLSLDGLEVRAVYVRDRPGPPARADGFGQGCSSEVHNGENRSQPVRRRSNMIDEARVRQFYDVARHRYSALLGEHWHHGDPKAEAAGFSFSEDCEILEERLLRLSRLPERGRVLDFGCGIGGPTLHMAEVSKDSFVGVSNNDPSLETARTHARERGLADRVTF